jgi:hypothetical protein
VGGRSSFGERDPKELALSKFQFYKVGRANVPSNDNDCIERRIAGSGSRKDPRRASCKGTDIGSTSSEVLVVELFECLCVLLGGPDYRPLSSECQRERPHRLVQGRILHNQAVCLEDLGFIDSTVPPRKGCP